MATRKKAAVKKRTTRRTKPVVVNYNHRMFIGDGLQSASMVVNGDATFVQGVLSITNGQQPVHVAFNGYTEAEHKSSVASLEALITGLTGMVKAMKSVTIQNNDIDDEDYGFDY